MKWFVLLLVLSFGFVLSAEEAVRTWTDLKGRTMKARFIKFTGDKMVIKRADGRSFTVMPDLFSEVDCKYVEEMRSKVGPDGKPWNRNSFRYLLIKDKWNANTFSGDRFFDFELEKIDIDGDGKPDGSKVWVKRKSKILKESRPMAWEVDDDGKLTIKYIDTIFKKMKVSVLNYDKKLGYFNSDSISSYPKFLKPHK